MKESCICRNFLKIYEWLTSFFFPGISPVLCLVLIKMGGIHIALAHTALNHFNKLTTEFTQMLQNLVLTICQHSKAFCSTGCVTKYSAHSVSFLNSWRKKRIPLLVLLRILTYVSLIKKENKKKVVALLSVCVHVFSRISTFTNAFCSFTAPLFCLFLF